VPEVPPESAGTVIVVDDNRSVRDSLAYLMHSVGLTAETYAGPADLLALVLEGLANKEIAARLDIRPKTVESHRASIMTKMGAGSLAQLVTHAIRNGITGKPAD